MGKQVEKTFRGKCTGKTLRKDGKPKHAGNFSYATLHAQSKQAKSWSVWRDKESGHLFVGEHTPLLCLLSAQAVQFATDDHTFTSMEFRSHRIMYGRQYEVCQRLTRNYDRGRWDDRKVEYVYTEEIWTDNDFKYKFENY